MIHCPIIGVDFSPACVALATARQVVVFRTAAREHEHSVERLHKISCWFGDALPATPGVAIVEGYGFNGSQNAHQLGELGGQLRLILWLRGWSILLVPPSTLKKFTDDNGKADKAAMRMRVALRWGFESEGDDEADAFALRAFGVLMHAHRTGAELHKPFKAATKAEAERFAAAQTLALSERPEDAWAHIEPKPKKRKGRKS